ncbi:hypothetical protein M758_8G027800 [Ceratodon purpureus]|uniref:Secreted protein n=1 Tax=Ceratodon purpureus TaxID=3225 RepID=A0A8T0GUK1_CERPU|nr:hypothetical protein KC19_8G028900 [Ceratodon purpureus]KAG0607431.1 hypothetical protein M758_8G027800 [Ceratodon purpureus]
MYVYTMLACTWRLSLRSFIYLLLRLASPNCLHLSITPSKSHTTTSCVVIFLTKPNNLDAGALTRETV